MNSVLFNLISCFINTKTKTKTKHNQSIKQNTNREKIKSNHFRYVIELNKNK